MSRPKPRVVRITNHPGLDHAVRLIGRLTGKDERSVTVTEAMDHALGVCRIGRTEEAKECWSGLQSDYGLHESMLSQIVGLGYPLPPT